MRLISLELHGFKSFADRTKINFDKGMTVIVGPNGSGKSNISDAIKWVLGELSAKNIRGTKLEDIIFGGTEKRSPMSFAEVTITIDNTGENRIDSEYDVITVTRRYFKSGDSEYLINSKPSKLKNIVELFMNTGIGKTGYSIVGQGRIGEIISQKSEERRYIFEEAAGISKYRIRKNESERKLVEINSNLERVGDIVSILEARVGPLEQEAAKARTYLEIFEKKKACDVALILYDIDALASQNEEFERAYALAKHNLEIADSAIESVNTRTDMVLTETAGAKAALEANRALLLSLTEEKHALEASLLVSKSNLTHISKEISRLKAEYEALEKTLSLSDEEKISLFEQLNECEKALDAQRAIQSEAEMALAEAEIAYRDLLLEHRQALSDKESCEKSRVDRQIRLSSIDSTQRSLMERTEQLARSLEEARQALLEIGSKISASKAKLSGLDERYEEAASEQNAAKAECDELIRTRKAIQDELNNIKAQIAAKTRQTEALKRMEEHFEGYQKSVKFVLDNAQQGRLDGICGTVSQIITVEPRYSTAIESALGGSIQNIVVENESSAKSAIALLKRSGVGRCTFYPITSVKGIKSRGDSAAILSHKGCIGVASDLVLCDARYNGIISFLLERTYVFDTLDNAEIAAKSTGYNLRAVTLDGQLINVGGSFTGGASKGGSGILTRSYEISALENEVEELLHEEKRVSERIKGIDSSLSEKESELSQIDSTFMLLSTLISAEKASLSMLEGSYESQTAQIETIKESIRHIESQKDASLRLKKTIEDEIISLGNSISEFEVRIQYLENEINNASDELKKATDTKNARALDTLSYSNEVELARKIYERHLSSRSTISEQIDLAKEGIILANEQYNNLEAELSSLEGQINDKTLECQRISDEISALNLKLASLENEDNALRAKLREKTSERDVYFQEFTKYELKRNSLGSEREKLTNRLYDEYELTYASAKELDYPAVTDKTRGHTVYELGKYRSKIRELGNVNVGAIEEYASVKSEYDFLSKQVDDLIASKNKYSSILAGIEREMRTRFSDTFERINDNFKVAFTDLFGGGNASLSLTDPSDVLTSGIEIKVAPPGKVINNLKALSGGEQVFVAIAILFAIFKVNPPPFCLLDEIESALDEVNVVKFAEYARRYCDASQFIVISHRRGTMEHANSLYGVTMQERGVTSLLSVNIDDIGSKLKLDE